MGHSHSGPHISPLSLYMKVFGALIVLTFVTVGVSYLGLPATPSIIVALIVATIKACFVSAWFMHLLHDTKFNLMLFLASFWFIGAFFVFTSLDLMTRDRITKYQGPFEFRKDRVESIIISKDDMGKKYSEALFVTSRGLVDYTGEVKKELAH